MKVRFITLDTEGRTNYIHKETEEVTEATWQLENEGHQVVTVQYLNETEWAEAHKDFDNGISIYDN